MLPTVMMEPLEAPEATRAWATACVTKKEPWWRTGCSVEHSRALSNEWQYLLIFYIFQIWPAAWAHHSNSLTSHAYLQIDLNDLVKLILSHVEQEVILGDACSIYTHHRWLEEMSLRGESRQEALSCGWSVCDGCLSSPGPHTCMLVTSFLTLSLEDTSTTATMWPWPLTLVCKLPRVSLADSSFTSATTTEAPSDAKRWHTARPIPLPPPGRNRNSWRESWRTRACSFSSTHEFQWGHLSITFIYSQIPEYLILSQ